MKKRAPGLTSGVILGTVCLIAGIAMRIWEPNFTGFFNRGHDAQSMAIWTLLLVLAAINYGYGLLSMYIQQKTNQTAIEATDNPPDPDQGT